MKTLAISALIVSAFFLTGCITEGGFTSVDPNDGYYRYWTGSSYVLVNPNDYYYYYGGSYYHHHHAQPIDIVVVRPPVGYRVIQGEPDFSDYYRTHESQSLRPHGGHHGINDWQKPRPAPPNDRRFSPPANERPIKPDSHYQSAPVPQRHHDQSLQNRQPVPMTRPQHQVERSSPQPRQPSPRLAPPQNHQPPPRLAPPSTPMRRSAPSIPPKRGAVHSPAPLRKK